MEIFVLGRLLWHRRLMVGLGAILALGAALAIGVSRPEAPSALATTRVMLDTPKSQEVKTTPFGAETLPWRASLLAHLMASEPNKQRLAGKLGIPREQLAVEDPALSVPSIASSLPKAASDVADITTAPYVLTLELPNPSLPLISIASAAPNRRAAKRLVVAARDILRSAAPPPAAAPATKTGEPESDLDAADTSVLYGYLVVDVAPIRVKTVAASTAPLMAVAASLFVFVLWCAGVTVLPGLARRLRGSRPRKNRRTLAVE